MNSKIRNTIIPQKIILASVFLACFVDIKLLNSIIVAGAPSLNGVMSMLYILVIALLFIVGLIFQHNQVKLNSSQAIIMSTCCFYYLLTDLLIGEPSVKISFFLTFTITAFLLPLIVRYDTKVLLRSIFIIPSFGILFSQQLFLNEIAEFGSISMGMSYALLIPVLATLIYLIYYFFDDRWKVKLILIPFIGCNIVYLFQMLAFGSRGPVLSIFVAIVISFIIKVKQTGGIKIRYSRLFTLILILTFAVVFFIPIMEYLSSKLGQNGLQFNFIEKIIRLESSGDVSNGRNELTNLSIIGFYESPILGHGIAQFENNTGYIYPHNFILQILYDGGLFLSSIIIFPLLISIKSKIKVLSRDEFVWIYYLLFCSVPGALFSGDLWNANVLWLFFGTILSRIGSKSQVKIGVNYE